MHREFAHIKQLKPGDMVMADSGFRCIECGEVLRVEEDADDKSLCVMCKGGIHTLETDVRGYVTGFYPCEGGN